MAVIASIPGGCGLKQCKLSDVLFSSQSMLYLFISPRLLTAEQCWVACGTALAEREHHTARPERLWVVHRLQAAKPGYDSKVCGAQSQLLNPMEAIKAFIFNA